MTVDDASCHFLVIPQRMRLPGTVTEIWRLENCLSNVMRKNTFCSHFWHCG